MATGSSILAAQQQEASDLAALQTSVTALLMAFANGSITPADAATILANVTADDASAKNMNTSIQAALTPPPVAG